MQTNTIVVQTLNNSFLQIDTEPSIARELSDFFSFMTPNYQFMPKFKNCLWDGKTRLYKILGSTLPSGLFGILLKFASDRDYDVIDRRTPSKYEKPTDEQIDAFCDDLKPHSDGKPISHYDYQLKAVKESIINERATIVSPTSSGKSLIIYSIMRWFQQKTDKKILILVPTVGLVTQMDSDFDDYASEASWCSADNVHKIHQGQKKKSTNQVYISTWQSIFKMPPEYFDQFDVVLCDETHLATAKSITGIMDRSKNASVRIGFTGTLKDTKLHQLSIVGLFGDIKRIETTSGLMNKGLITPIDIKFCVLKYEQSICKEINRKIVEKITPTGKKIYRDNYQNEMDYITQSMARNIYICNLVSVLPGNTLVLFNKIQKHGKPLFELLKKRLGSNRNVRYVSGETKANKREQIRNSIENDDDSVVVASYGVFSTGVNVKSLQYVIFASPYKSEIKVLQSIGRVLRKKKRKKKAVLFDMVDDFRYKKSVNYSFKHFQRRWEIYKSEKFPVSINEYKLK